MEISAFLAIFPAILIFFIVLVSQWVSDSNDDGPVRTSGGFEVAIRSIPPVEPKIVVREKIVYKEKEKRECTAKTIPIAPSEDHTKSVAFREAKNGLMSMGFSAGSSKLALEKVGPCSTAEEYIQKVLIRK